MREVLGRLGLSVGGWTYLRVRERIRQLGIDARHLARDWAPDPLADVTDAALETAACQAHSMPEMMRILGLKGSEAAYAAVLTRLEVLGVSKPHGSRTGVTVRAMKDVAGGWTDEDLRSAVAACPSVRQVVMRLGFRPTSANTRCIRQRVQELDLDTSHMLGQAIHRGTRWPGRYRIPLEDILVRDSDYQATARLRERLVIEGIKNRACELCGLTEWQGKPAPLQLDHINGDRRDNRLTNLRIVCPNCHSQTETWCGRNIGSYEET